LSILPFVGIPLSIKLEPVPWFSAVLIAEEDWRAIKETLHLCSVPGMRESIQEGLSTPVAECSKELEW
jgi:PHD/YefM family antitoxin component YafN of YafNO toxin-antitoxin module